MLAPLSWIKDFVDVDVTPSELENKLFDCGFEVERIIPYGDKLDKVVACKIIDIKQHPNAERLRVCQVDAGKYGVLQIITNAVNVSVGDIVPVAVDGATLATGEKITAGKLRGEPSYGMFCGGEELGIDDDFYDGASFDGVLVFKEDLPLGEEIKDLLALEDYVFDISVLANRPDCQSVLGISREIAAALDKPFKEPSYDYEVVKTDDEIKVKVEDQELCPRYIATLIKDVKIEKSPKSITRRLKLCGINSINSIVDITNYVLLELGQPMHAFDDKDLKGREIVVRRANDGEKMVALDEKELTLSSENLVICSGGSPVALAGIIGGLDSEIKDDTTAVVFECAKFKRDNVRKSSRTLGKSTDSSKRFEKGVDEYTTERAMNRALSLVCRLGVGTVTSARTDVSAGLEQENKEVDTTFDKINGVLGIEIPKDVVVGILKKLNFQVRTDGDEISAVAPPYREDVYGYPDLAEEVIRTYGYEHIEPSLLKDAKITLGGYSKEQNDELKLKKILCGEGYNEVMTYSFYSKKDLAALNLRDGDPEGDVIIVENPISDNYEVMRRTLVPSFLGVISRNLKRGVASGRIFEVARTYEAKSKPISDFPIERKNLCLAVFGDDEDFFSLKGALDAIAESFRVKFKLDERADKTYLHSGVSAKIIVDGEHIGNFGQVAYETAEAYDIDRKVYVLELDYDALASKFVVPFKFEPLPKFPDISRDLALVADQGISCGEIESVIRSACKQNVKDVKLFDVYVGEQVGVGKKSMAFAITFRAGDDKPLENEDADAFVKRILGSLKHRLGVELR